MKKYFHIFINYENARDHLIRNINDYSRIKTLKAKVRNADKMALATIVDKKFASIDILRITIQDKHTFTKLLLVNRGVDLLAVMDGTTLSWSMVVKNLNDMLTLRHATCEYAKLLQENAASAINLMVLQAGLTQVTRLNDAYTALDEACEQLEGRYSLWKANFKINANMTIF